jgi:hypothetical protein
MYGLKPVPFKLKPLPFKLTPVPFKLDGGAVIPGGEKTCCSVISLAVPFSGGRIDPSFSLPVQDLHRLERFQ